MAKKKAKAGGHKMSKTLIYELPDHEVIEIPVPREMP